MHSDAGRLGLGSGFWSKLWTGVNAFILEMGWWFFWMVEGREVEELVWCLQRMSQTSPMNDSLGE